MAKGNWRDDVDKALMKILRTEGLEAFMATAVAALNVDPHGDGLTKSQFVGEVCEVVMLGMTQEYLSVTGRKAQLYHSVVLKDLKNPKGDFRTECDFVLVSPSFVMTTECKSYCGSVSISGDFTLSNKNSKTNVYTQSLLHYNKLKLYCEQAVKPGLGIVTPPVFASVFVFSDSTITDKRTSDAQRKLRLTTTANMFDYYEALFSKYKKPVYDYEKLCKVFGLASRSKKLHSEHAGFVGY